MIISVALLVGAALFARSFRKRQYNLIGMRHKFFMASGVLLIVCLGSLLINGFQLFGGKLNYSLDFTGGTIVELGFVKHDIKAEDIFTAIEEFNTSVTKPEEKLKKPVVQMANQLKVVEYPEKYRPIDITIKKKDGSTFGADELKGILTPFDESFGKTILLEESSAMGGPRVTLKMGFSEYADKPASTDRDKGVDGPVATRISRALAGYDKNLELVEAKDAEVITLPQKAREYKTALIRITREDNSNLASDEVMQLIASLSRTYGNIYKFKVESIGPTIGGELRTKAIYAVLIALGIQLIYITIRFGNQVRYGLAADIALFHDLIVMIGIYSIVGREIDSPFIAAILTVVGYSVMDSIVIFDRIRENLKIFKKESYEEAVNISVNQTMSRSVNTLLTVLITLFALFFFGGTTLKNFAFALLIGCTVGAYSSIFIASPLLVIIDDYVKKKESERVAARRAELAAQSQAKSDRVKAEKAAEAEGVEESGGDGSDRKAARSRTGKKKRYQKTEKK